MNELYRRKYNEKKHMLKGSYLELSRGFGTTLDEERKNFIMY